MTAPSRFPLPTNLVAMAAEAGNLDGWLTTLPRYVADLARRWSLELAEPFQPGGRTAWVAPARDGSGADVVLKVGFRHPEGETEAAGLRAWDGDGAVRLVDETRSDDTIALLLERCDPGTSLSTRPGPEQDEVLAALLPRLWIEPPAGHPFRSLASMCDDWADRSAVRFAASPPPLDPDVVALGLDLLRTLPTTAERVVMLTTDLHADNVLAARREPWLVIDPKPHVGDPTYDAVQHLLNSRRLRDDPVGLVERVAGLLDLDADRLRRWTFARCVQEAGRWDGLAAVARTLRPD